MWDSTHPQKCNSLKEKDELFKNITDSINLQFKENQTLEQVKKKLNGIFKEYEKEVEKKIYDKSRGEKTQLWFHDNMEFLRPLIENKVKLKRVNIKVANQKNVTKLMFFYIFFTEKVSPKSGMFMV